MTTPNGQQTYGPPTQIIVGVQGTSPPVQVWQRQPNAGAIFLINQDVDATIYLGNRPSIQAGGTDTAILPPQGTLSLPGTLPWYAITDDNVDVVAPMLLLPGGGNFSPAPAAIAASFIAAGIPTMIAQAISAGGISLLSSPIPLFGTNQPPAAASGLVGASVFKAAYSGSTSDISAGKTFDQNVGVPMSTNARKVFYSTEGSFPSAGNDSQNIPALAANGDKVNVILKPLRDPTNAYTGAAYTAQFNALAAAITYIVGAATNGVTFALWNEPNLFINGVAQFTNAQYAAYVNFYAPAFKTPNQAANQRLSYVPTMSQHNGSAMFPGYSGTGWTLDAITPDAYCLDFIKASGGQNFVNELNALLALANTGNLYFGFWEWGISDGVFIPSPAQFVSWSSTYIRGTMTSRIAASQKNEDTIWWAGGPTNAIIKGSTDPTIIKEIDTTFNALSTAPVASFTVNPGATVTLTPLNPSPGAGFAIANGISYDAVFTFQSQTPGSSTNPFCRINVAFPSADTPNSNIIEPMRWNVPIGGGGGKTIIGGTGPQRGSFMRVQITNLDTIAVTVTAFINSTSRPVTKDKWYWDAAGSNGVPGFTLPNFGEQFSLSLGVLSSISVPASSSKAFLMGMYAGPAYLRVNGDAGGHLNFLLTPMPTSVWGTASLFNETPSGELTRSLYLPRCPTLCTITNSDAGAAHTGNVELVVDQ